jgi:hypothetical protein
MKKKKVRAVSEKQEKVSPSLEVAIGRVELGFGSGRSGQFDFLEEIGLGRVGSGSDRIGSIYMLCFFRSLIDFDWIEYHLISGRVGSGRVRIGSG